MLQHFLLTQDLRWSGKHLMCECLQNGSIYRRLGTIQRPPVILQCAFNTCAGNGCKLAPYTFKWL